jgi:hypothetical protein
MSKRKLIIGFCVIMIILASSMMWVALGFAPKEPGTSMPGSRFFPMLTLALIVCFSLALIVKNFFMQTQAPEESEQRVDLSKFEVLRVASVAASGFVAYALWSRVGFLPIAGFLILAIGLILRVRSVWSYIGLAAIAVAMFFIMNSLGVPLGAI